MTVQKELMRHANIQTTMNVYGKRVSLSVADELVTLGLANRVSEAGRARLKLGLRIKKLDSYRGAAASVTTTGRRAAKDHLRRCRRWRQPA